MNDLDAALLAAHATGEITNLIRLYATAAEATDALEQAAFYLTHAYVFALEAGDPAADTLHQRLIEMGRDVPLSPPVPPKR